MSNRLDETLGTVGYDNLINGLYPPAEPFSVVIRKGSAETTYKRGTVLALSTGTAGDGKYVILGTTAASNETLTANCVLAEDVTVGTANDETAVAYRTDEWIKVVNFAPVQWRSLPPALSRRVSPVMSCSQREGK